MMKDFKIINLLLSESGRKQKTSPEIFSGWKSAPWRFSLAATAPQGINPPALPSGDLLMSRALFWPTVDVTIQVFLLSEFSLTFRVCGATI